MTIERLCPEAAKRDAMTDGEFWDYVFNRPDPRDPYSDGPEPDHEPIGPRYDTPCTECGQLGACGYDSAGRPMIHLQDDLEGDPC